MIFPQTEEKVLCLSWCCSASPLVTGAGQRGDHTGQSELVSPTKRTTPPHTTSTSWSPQPSGPQLLTPHHINKLVSPTKRTTSHHTTPTHQDGARHCLPSDHLDRLGSFLGHRSQCCEWLKLLIPSLYGGQPLIKAQSKYSTFQFLCSEVEGTKK